MKQFLLFLLLLMASSINIFAQPSPGSEYADLRLITDYTHVEPGQTFMAGLHIELADGWHTYWINPGDSGIPVMIGWLESDLFSKGDIKWPYPSPFREEYLTTFGYKDETLLMVPVTVSKDAELGNYVLEASIQFLVCEKICLPGFADVSTQVFVAQENQPSSYVSIFETFSNKLPVSSSGLTASFEQTDRNVSLEISDSGDILSSVDSFMFYASEENILESTSNQDAEVLADRLIFSFQSSRYNPNPIEVINGVLVVTQNRVTKAYQVQATTN